MSSEHVLDIVERHSVGRDGLISILQEVQGRFGYLPVDALKAVATRTGRSLVDVYGVATFYRSFSLKPRGRHLCSVCLGTACHVRGGAVISEEFRRELGVEAGETTTDGEFTLETVNCLGTCAIGPVTTIDTKYHGGMKPAKVEKILKSCE